MLSSPQCSRITVKVQKPWTQEIFMECYCFWSKNPITREKTKPQTVTLISLWFHVASDWFSCTNENVKTKSKCSRFFDSHSNVTGAQITTEDNSRVTGETVCRLLLLLFFFPLWQWKKSYFYRSTSNIFFYTIDYLSLLLALWDNNLKRSSKTPICFIIETK